MSLIFGKSPFTLPSSPEWQIDHIQNDIVGCIDFSEKINKLLQDQRGSDLKPLLKEAKLARLSLPDLDRYLTCLERASFITLKEKAKQLFLYGCERDCGVFAKDYLVQAGIDPYQLLMELLSLDEPPAQAICELCRGGIDLKALDATISNFLFLLELGVSPHDITINNAPSFVWAFSTQNGHLIREVCKYGPQLQPHHGSQPDIVAYFRAKDFQQYELPNPCDILGKLHRLGASVTTHVKELLAFAARWDDESFADLLLNACPLDQFPDDVNPLSIVCSIPQANKVVLRLLRRGAQHDVMDAKHGEYPLHIALRIQNFKAAMHLLEAGANVYLEDSQKNPALYTILRSPELTQRYLVLHQSMYRQGVPIGYWLPVVKQLPASSEVSNFLCMVLQKQRFPISEHYQDLFFELIRLNVWNLLQSMMQKGFDLHLSLGNKPSCFSRLVAEKKFDVIKWALDQDYLHPDVKVAEDLSLLFWAVENKRIELLETLNKKEVDLFVTNKEKMTVLHLAVKKKYDPCLVYLLENGCREQVNALDIHKRPPLYYAFAPLNEGIVVRLLGEGALPCYLGDRMVECLYVAESKQRFDLILGKLNLYKEFCQRKNKDIPLRPFLTENARQRRFEALEIRFLLPSLGFRAEGYVSKEDYLKDLLLLRDKYPDVPLESFYSLLLNIALGHLQRKTQEFAIAPITTSVDVKQLLTYFDALNWNQPEEPYYCDPKKVKVMGATSERETLRNSLQALVETYVPQRTEFTGIPPRGPGLELFYNNLETILKHITLMLSEERDPLLRKKALLKLSWATVKCGTRWEEMGLRVYKLLKFKKKNEHLWEDAFDEELLNMREILARNIGGNNVHGYRQVVRHIGNEFHIPLSSGIANVTEPYEKSFLTHEYCRFFFLNSYRQDLIFSRVLEFFKTSFQKNDGAIIKWFMHNVPSSYTPDGLEELSWACQAIPLMYSDPNEKKAAIQRLFNDKGMYISPAEISEDLNPEPLLKRYRASEYIAAHVYDLDTAEILFDGLIYFLTNRQVLSERFPGIFSAFLEACKKKKSSTVGSQE